MLFRSLYSNAGAAKQFRTLADTVEQLSLKQIAITPNDFEGYYSPYRILLDIYEKRGEYLKAAHILERVDSISPGNAQVRAEIERYKTLAATPKTATPPVQEQPKK